MGMIFLNQDLK